jgi:uncharacterized OB-fold protein
MKETPVPIDARDRPLPIPTPETAHFWAGTREGRLLLQRCLNCDAAYFPPRPFCPTCSSSDIEVISASGRGTLESYVISHLPAPGFEPPYSIAVVALAEGPRILSNVVECPQTPDALQLDMPLEVVFEQVSDSVTLPLVRPVTQ